MIRAADIERMSVEERLQAMELLWVSLTCTPEAVPTPDWHEAVVNERLEKVQAGKAEFLSVDEVEKRLRKPSP